MLKAIDTEYGDANNRSRNEGRWEVFFDVLDIEWIYEPEGVEVSGDAGSRYLPDLYLPELNCWAELKGPQPIPASELYKVAKFENGDPDKIATFDRSRNRVMLLHGPPSNGKFKVRVFQDQEWFQGKLALREGYKCKCLGVISDTFTISFLSPECLSVGCWLDVLPWRVDHELLLHAYKHASHARWEHGLNPKAHAMEQKMITRGKREIEGDPVNRLIDRRLLKMEWDSNRKVLAETEAEREQRCREYLELALYNGVHRPESFDPYLQPVLRQLGKLNEMSEALIHAYDLLRVSNEVLQDYRGLSEDTIH